MSEQLSYPQQDNFSRLTGPLTYDKEKARRTVPQEFWNHPDFGILPPGTACSGCYEEIQLRTATERHFRSLDNPGIFYIHKSAIPINFQKNGTWLSMDPRLVDKGNGIFGSRQEPIDCSLNIPGRYSEMGGGNDNLHFNNFSMKEFDLQGNETDYTANWQQYTVGDDGIYISNIFPGIDMAIQFKDGSVKSTLLVKQYRPNSARIVFTDEVDLFPGAGITYAAGQADGDSWVGDLSINDANGTPHFTYGQIRIFDGGDQSTFFTAPYTVEGNKINLNIDGAIYNANTNVYPVAIDPTVTYGPFNSGANPIGAGLSPAFCSTTITVSVPAGATYTDFQAAWSVTNTNNCGCGSGLIFYTGCGCFTRSCHLLWDQLYITSSCGGATPVGAPGSVWTCAGCNGYGTWLPTLPFGSSGCTSMSTCIPPSCSNQNITYTLFLNQFICGVAACGSCTYATNTCAHLNSWSVTIRGETVNQNTAPSSSAGTTICPYACTNLTATGQYGVPAYSYAWSPGGGTTNPFTVCPTSTTTYTCVITDACGTTASNTITIITSGCLKVELLNFDGMCSGNSVYLNWMTGSETNNDHFTIERSDDGENFEDIGTVQGAGTTSERHNYLYTDESPLPGTSYYRLKQTDYNGQSAYSNIISVNAGTNKKDITAVPNPTNGLVEVKFLCDEEGEAMIQLFDGTSRSVLQKKIQVHAGLNSISIDLSDYSKGLYHLVAKTPGSDGLKHIGIARN